MRKNLCTVLIPLCKNSLNLPISHTDYYPLIKQEQPLPVFLVSNTEVLNPYSQSRAFNTQSSAPLS